MKLQPRRVEQHVKRIGVVVGVELVTAP